MNYAVILAGGKGLRVGGDVPKQLLNLAGKPVIRWSVEAFHSVKEIHRIIIVGEINSLEKIRGMLPQSDFPKIIRFIEGGAERFDSSYNALVSGDFFPEDIILFHDAARPFISAEIIRNTVTEIAQSGAAGVYIPAVDTVTVAENGAVVSIPERKNVFYAQTPQGFRYGLIREAHEKYRSCKNSIKVTDDVALAMASGHVVKVVEGSISNFKITTDLDYRIAEFIAQNGLIK